MDLAGGGVGDPYRLSETGNLFIKRPLTNVIRHGPGLGEFYDEPVRGAGLRVVARSTSRKFGTAMAAKIAMMATTMSSSMSVKFMFLMDRSMLQT